MNNVTHLNGIDEEYTIHLCEDCIKHIIQLELFSMDITDMDIIVLTYQDYSPIPSHLG